MIKRTTETGYIWDNRFIWGSFLIMILMVLYTFYLYDWNLTPKPYLKCLSYNGCENPFYTAQYKASGFDRLHNTKDLCDWCNQPTLPMGEYGTKEPFIVKYFTLIGVCLVAISFLLNHFVHNKGKKVDFGLKHFHYINNIMEKLNLGDEENEQDRDKDTDGKR